jgi:hypothetical protein
MPNGWFAKYLGPGKMPRYCSETCMHRGGGEMAVEWKRKKSFDGTTCGVKGCSRKAGGYQSDTRECTANKNGRLWYGPICTKCCSTDKGPCQISDIAQQRNGVRDMAELFNISADDMNDRMRAAGVPGEFYLVKEARGLPPVGPSVVATEAEEATTREMLEIVKQFQILNADDFKLAVEEIEKARIGRAKYEKHLPQSTIVELYRAIEADLGNKIVATRAAFGAATEAAPPIEEPESPPDDGEWDFTITNPVFLPRQYLVEDMKKIKAAVKKGVRDISGVHIFRKGSA